MKLSCIMPTIGRSTLFASAMSVLHQLTEEDELMVVGDGPRPGARNQWNKICVTHPPYRALYLETETAADDAGCTPIDYGIRHAVGDYVWFAADDDTCPDGAVAAIRSGVALAPGDPHLFAMEHTGRTLSRNITCGNVSGQQIVVPRDMSKMPLMANFKQKEVSDWEFIHHVIQAWRAIHFHDDVISVLTRMNFGKEF